MISTFMNMKVLEHSKFRLWWWLCIYTKHHYIVYFKGVIFMTCKFYLTKDIFFLMKKLTY